MKQLVWKWLWDHMGSYRVEREKERAKLIRRRNSWFYWFISFFSFPQEHSKLSKEAGMVLATFQRDNLHLVPSPDPWPIPIEEIVKWLEIDLVYKSGLICSSALNSTGERPIIYVRSEDLPIHQRFAIAHQLGHLFLHEPGFHDYKLPDIRSDSERECNQFAADLLLPLSYVFSYGFRTSFLDYKRIAKQFKVSDTAALYQMKRYRMIP